MNHRQQFKLEGPMEDTQSELQVQLWGQTWLLRALSSQVLKFSKDGN